MTKKSQADFARYFNRQGEPIPLEEWAKLSEDRKYKIVEQTTVGVYWISTVWLGLDHGWGMTGRSAKPVIFESMVFEQYRDNPEAQGLVKLMDANYSPWNEKEMDRYETEDEARAGHARLVEKWSRPQ